MKAIGHLLALLGAAVFTLPWWLPRVAEVTVQPEAFARAGQVGGALIGVGIGLVLIGLLRRRRAMTGGAGSGMRRGETE